MSRQDVPVLGTVVGTYGGNWDQTDCFSQVLYDFEPNEIGRSLGMIAGDLHICLEEGWSQGDSMVWNRLHLTKVEA